MFAREGYVIIGAAIAIAAVLVVVGMFMAIGWTILFCLIAAFVVGFTLYFFRDPFRTPPAGAEAGHLLLSPADGKVVVVADDVDEPLYIKGRARQVSIFLSPLNVHVNRVPADGVVEYVEYVPGEYLVAWHEKASEKNERSILGLVHPSGTRVVFKQIAGAVARRIVYHLKEGERVKAGQRYGIVKFGSRMDVLVPPHVRLDVKVGQKVVAGETIIGYIPGTEAAGAAADRRSARA